MKTPQVLLFLICCTTTPNTTYPEPATPLPTSSFDIEHIFQGENVTLSAPKDATTDGVWSSVVNGSSMKLFSYKDNTTHTHQIH
nr:hypothetical protein [Tawny frogmouth aviadenovirus A]